MSTSRGVQKVGRTSSSTTMASSSASRRYCDCGKKVVKYTANSEWNRGREFWRCPIWSSPLTCNYFKWVDEEEMMEDAVYMNFVGQQLEEAMKKNEKLKKKLAGSRQKASCWFFVAVGSWAMTLFMCIKCGQKSMGTGCIEVGN